MLKSPVLTLLVFFLGTIHVRSVHAQENSLSPPVCSQTVYFRFDKAEVESAYMDNRHALSALDSLFSDPVYVWSIDSIYIHAYSSPEGKSDYNLELSRRRSQAMSKYLTERYPMLKLGSRISCISGGENWDGMREAVVRASDFNEREEVLMIIDQVSDLARREQLLKRLNAGLAYRYIKDNILPPLRNAVVCVIRTRRPLPDKRHPPLPPVRSFPLHSATVQPQLREGAETVSPPDAKRVRPARYAALKTNLAAWAATTVNLAYEVQVGRRFTLDLPLMWSSWDITAEHALRVIAFQPELRYWFSSAGKGHFVGVHAHAARYNLKWNATRYQDNECPLFGVGVSYGYAFSLGPSWGMELNIGGGYAQTRYRLYSNVPNGAWLDTRTLRYWGLTRLGVSFIYKLPQP